MNTKYKYDIRSLDMIQDFKLNLSLNSIGDAFSIILHTKYTTNYAMTIIYNIIILLMLLYY
jgi:hypothetical protein